MGRYIRRTEMVDAFQWTADINQTEDPEWIVDALKRGQVWFMHSGSPRVIMRLCNSMRVERIYTAHPSDWIIRHASGDLTVCPGLEFDELYKLCPLGRGDQNGSQEKDDETERKGSSPEQAK